jgi:hypothetical protein
VWYNFVLSGLVWAAYRGTLRRARRLLDGDRARYDAAWAQVRAPFAIALGRWCGPLVVGVVLV